MICRKNIFNLRLFVMSVAVSAN